MATPVPHNKEYVHHSNPHLGATIRELVFGMEDGMVSTLGAITGIAAGSNNHFIVVLAGLVIISVESISMAVGSYLSSKSERAIDERKLHEEAHELDVYPEEEKKELIDMYIRDGWPAPLAADMAHVASQNKNLFLQEMAFRELQIIPDKMERPIQNALVMWFSYIAGGIIPLFPYFFFSFDTAVWVSVVITLIGLFLLGVGTTTFSKRSWWKAGMEMFILASAAAFIGYAVGSIVDTMGMGRF
ncbi:MAG TPA: VIT1/CCC1 transporter family protein [Candidatus Kapabacteria bacterium]|nr:VIT1/CCC1 transporter family protein [Candidatus Kapabacteria bacterium]